MKVISICQNCKGNGSIISCKFLKRTCPMCKGTGKIKKHVSDIKKEQNRKIQSLTFS